MCTSVGSLTVIVVLSAQDDNEETERGKGVTWLHDGLRMEAEEDKCAAVVQVQRGKAKQFINGVHRNVLRYQPYA